MDLLTRRPLARALTAQGNLKHQGIYECGIPASPHKVTIVTNWESQLKIEEVGYIGIDAKETKAWHEFASGYVGFEVRPLQGGSLGLRMDEYPWRIQITPAQRDGLGFMGLRVESGQELETVRREMAAAGFQVHDCGPADLAARSVEQMVWVQDPDGHRVEFFVGRQADAQAFKPGRPIGGFRTGALGFGHLVLVTTDLPAMENFYMKLIGFRLSDYIEKDIKIRFTHINGRHHSLALVGGPSQFLHHIMVEYKHMDDVGRLYDKALRIPGMIQTSLGRHENDHVLSFYSKTPGGFLLETGWGGRVIDSENWTPEELWCMSLWGHERSWETPEMQAKQRAQKELAAEQGLLAPVEVNDAGGFFSR